MDRALGEHDEVGALLGGLLGELDVGRDVLGGLAPRRPDGGRRNLKGRQWLRISIITPWGYSGCRRRLLVRTRARARARVLLLDNDA